MLLDGATNLGTTEVDNASDGSSTQYFSYDGLNRQLHVSWTSATSIGVKGHTLTYDADGNRLSDTFSGNALSVTYDASNVPTFTAVNGIATETYTYDADDRLSQVFYGVNNSGSTQQILIDERHYDSASRLLSSGGAGPFGMLDQLNKVDTAHGIVGDALDINPRSYLYDERGEVTSVATYATLQPGMAYSNNAMTYTYDEAGNKIGTVLNTQSMDAASYVRTFVDTTTTHYMARDSYIETDEGSTETSTLMLQGSPSTRRSVTTTYSTTTNNDANGFATKVANVQNTGSSTIDMTGTSDLVNDAQGRVLSSTLELAGSKRERNLIIDGQEIGQYGVFNDPVIGNKQIKDFSFTYKSLEDQSVTSSTSIMVAQGSERLADLAESIYGDRQLWRRIAAANGYSSNGTVQAGQRIVLAGNPGASHNDASTFRAYDASAVIGTQTPYGQADTGTMTLNGQNPMSMSAQEQSDYSMDVYGKNYHKPFFFDHDGGGMEISGATVVDGTAGETGSGVSTQTETLADGSTVSVRPSDGTVSIAGIDGSSAVVHIAGDISAAGIASGYAAFVEHGIAQSDAIQSARLKSSAESGGASRTGSGLTFAQDHAARMAASAPFNFGGVGGLSVDGVTRGAAPSAGGGAGNGNGSPLTLGGTPGVQQLVINGTAGVWNPSQSLFYSSDEKATYYPLEVRDSGRANIYVNGHLDPTTGALVPGAPSGASLSPEDLDMARARLGYLNANYDTPGGLTGAWHDVKDLFGSASPLLSADQVAEKASIGSILASTSVDTSVVYDEFGLQSMQGAGPIWNHVVAPLASGSSVVADWSQHNHVLTRAFGALQMVGGIAETSLGGSLMVVGAGTSEVGVGIPVLAGGAALMSLGLDQSLAGFRTLVSGETKISALNTGLQSAGMSPTAAGYIDAGVNVVGVAGGTRVLLAPIGVATSGGSVVQNIGNTASGAPTVPGMIVNSPDGAVVDLFGRPVSARTQSIVDRFGDARRVSVVDETTGNATSVQIVDGLRANDVRVGDLGKLQAATGNEFNLMRGPGGERVLIQGEINATGIPSDYIGDGWTWSGHSHPYSAVASDTDRALLRALGQDSSVIKSAATGQQLQFTQFEDLSNWTPPVFIR